MSYEFLGCREYTVSERVADGVIHAIGVAGSLVATCIVLTAAIPSLPAQSTLSLFIYGLAMVAMFSFSAAYHLTPVPHWKSGLRRLDKAAIFLKIAGTYTPFAAVSLGGFLGFGLLGVVWTVALFGAFAMLFFQQGLRGYSIFLYLGLGWSVLVVIQPLYASLPVSAMILLAAGGALYTIGVIFHLWERLPFQNAIWHLFVLVATSCHFAAIVDTVVLL